MNLIDKMLADSQQIIAEDENLFKRSIKGSGMNYAQFRFS